MGENPIEMPGANGPAESERDGEGRRPRAAGPLVDASELTETQERLRAATEQMRKSERLLAEAQALGHTGSWEQDLVTGEIFNTEENLRLFFGDDGSKGVRIEDYVGAIHPDDRDWVMRGGELEIVSARGRGTMIRATFGPTRERHR